jgi:hypothetical protein
MIVARQFIAWNRSKWNPSRRVRYDPRPPTYRHQYVGAFGRKLADQTLDNGERETAQQSIDHTVPYGTDLPPARYQAMNCLLLSFDPSGIGLFLRPFLPLLDDSFQDKFDLAVDAPELFLSPRFQLPPKSFVDPQ